MKETLITCKVVHLMLRHNPNGYAGFALQTLQNIVSSAIKREKEMKWTKNIGVAAIKVGCLLKNKVL